MSLRSDRRLQENSRSDCTSGCEVGWLSISKPKLQTLNPKSDSNLALQERKASQLIGYVGGRQKERPMVRLGINGDREILRFLSWITA